ncbi:MAG TPA: hypothetical protein DCR93_29070 [Cytophagales bacterium]|nr:hypothetical protein [Cytophagales bacterium]HAP63381.1 hypothetical protein [Cytophagales bacterium]
MRGSDVVLDKQGKLGQVDQLLTAPEKELPEIRLTNLKVNLSLSTWIRVLSSSEVEWVCSYNQYLQYCEQNVVLRIHNFLKWIKKNGKKFSPPTFSVNLHTGFDTSLFI